MGSFRKVTEAFLDQADGHFKMWAPYFGVSQRTFFGIRQVEHVLNGIISSLMLDCDLAYPVILSSDGRVMDGMHRIGKALLEGHSHIEAVRFLIDPEPDYINVHPDDLPYPGLKSTSTVPHAEDAGRVRRLS